MSDPKYRSDLDMAETLDAADVSSVKGAMQQEWGEEYHTNLRLVNRHLNSMPEEKRVELETGTLGNGTRLLNDPVTLKRLAAEARVSSESRADIEKIMREDPRRYYADDRLQARYRELLRK